MGTRGAVCSSTEVYSTPGLHSVFLCIFLALPYLSLIKIKIKIKTNKQKQKHNKSFLKLKQEFAGDYFQGKFIYIWSSSVHFMQCECMQE